jgi:CubicO group peptidase (beta-lactamase class C family)
MTLCARLILVNNIRVVGVDKPVKHYWPEFADERVLVKHCFSHTAGVLIVPGWREFIKAPHWLGVADVEEVTTRLAHAEPSWKPGTKIAYHGLTVGWLTGEIVRRIDGRRIPQFFDEEIAKPLGLEFWIGLPEEHDPRVTVQTVEDTSSDADPQRGAADGAR